MPGSSTPEPAVHLICGATGAGKTTLAIRLAGRLGGVRFSLDDWMQALFWPDLPARDDFPWAEARIARCMDRIKAMIVQVAPLGIPSIVDAGFTTRAERAAFAGWARGLDLTVRLHHVDLPADLRWRRVEERNAERGAAYAFAVTREMFDFMEAMWEPPDDEEMAALASVRVTE